MYLLRFTETPLYAKVENNVTQLVPKAQATHYPTKAEAEATLSVVGEFFAVERHKKG
jgi:hypothetical protein